MLLCATLLASPTCPSLSESDADPSDALHVELAPADLLTLELGSMVFELGAELKSALAKVDWVMLCIVLALPVLSKLRVVSEYSGSARTACSMRWKARPGLRGVLLAGLGTAGLSDACFVRGALRLGG